MDPVNRVVVVGSGGREHALASALARTAEVVVTPGSPGIPGSVKTPPEELDADLFVIGPEAPLVDGLADSEMTVVGEDGDLVALVPAGGLGKGRGDAIALT